MGNKPEREFSDSWTQYHCHTPMALQEPSTPGLPLVLALGWGPKHLMDSRGG